MQLIYNETVQGKTCCIVGHSMGGALAVHLSYLVGNSGLGNFGFSIYFGGYVWCSVTELLLQVKYCDKK